MAEPFRIHNTLTRQTEEFEPLEPGKVSLYVCGMTVYDHCHVGHARAMVTFDVFTRYLTHRGWEVRFVRNFTDVDDKIIRRAQERGMEALELAQRYIDSFHEDVAALGLMRPSVEPRVSESMEEIVALIQDLVDGGHAYASEGSVWFDVASDPSYGKLSRQKVEELRSADPEAGKKAGADFALWKAAKPGEPAWDSPWGPGRPGWHIECSAMAKQNLGPTIDIHGGGLDLVFPHHENELAQSECGNGQPFARYWMHNGLLNMASGQKMSKSVGNVVNIREALVEFPAEAIRLYYLQNHYRSPLPWNREALPEALAMLARLYDAREAAEAMGGDEDAEQVAHQLGKDAITVLERGRAFPERFYAAMDEDFNTAEALGKLFSLARAINRFAGHKKAQKRGGPVVRPALAAFDLVSEALGLVAAPTEDFQEEVKSKRLAAMGLEAAAVEERIAQRSAARAERNWQEADRIRDELEADGIVIMDRPDGVDWRVRLSERGD